ncbi:MAG: rhodanese-like domain-containing protein [Gammaproteobacteria bacterium]|jgi:rhodanese-related sulfurtransferase
MKNSIFFGVLIFSALITMNVMAANLEVRITDDKPYSVVNHGKELVKVQRIQDTSHTIDGSFAKTSRPCPPFCVNPLNIADGVATVAELEVIKFMETAMHRGDGVMIDARTPSWHDKGTIPGSVNIPFTVFEKPADDPELAEVLERLGARERDDVNVVMRSLEKVGMFSGSQKTDTWDFSEAKQLLLWCNGPWCGQSPRAIRALISLGYPAEKLYYYRGGMQMWQSLGLTTVLPSDVSNYASK